MAEPVLDMVVIGDGIHGKGIAQAVTEARYLVGLPKKPPDEELYRPGSRVTSVRRLG